MADGALGVSIPLVIANVEEECNGERELVLIPGEFEIL